MLKCTKHPHSTEETARRCAERAAGKRADKQMKPIAYSAPYRYKQKRHCPPTRIKINNITYLVFYSGV